MNFKPLVKLIRETNLTYKQLEDWDHTFFGLFAEVGEYSAIWQMQNRGDRKYLDFKVWKPAMRKELGDILYYWCAHVMASGESPEEIFEELKNKLESRKIRGKIKGDGDNR